MLFHSYTFVFVFMPAVLLGVAALARSRRHAATLGYVSGASLLFYAWWSWHDVLVLGASIIGNYGCARLIDAERAAGRLRRARLLLAVGLTLNLATLGYFKYTDFAIGTINGLLGTQWALRGLVLPLGISFFTFEQVTYLVDTSRAKCPPHGFLPYVTFLSFFPRLIAGPIVRPSQILPQLTVPGMIATNATTLSDGLFIFAIGLFKKLLLADTLATYVDPVFAHAGHVSFSDAWGAALAFALQVYFDFSAYSDMAVGLARMMRIELPENFDSPYQATSIIDFWRRWHMTLSNFLRDYLYIPLGGNRVGTLRRDANLLFTMLVAGLWHGANWTFVLFGGVHGLFLVINTWWRRTGIQLPTAVAWLVTFTAVVTSFVLFRAASFERALLLLGDLAGLGGFAWDGADYSIGRHEWKRILPLLAVVLWAPNRQQIMTWQWRSDLAYALAFSLLMGVSILRMGNPRPFYYFQF